LLDRQDFGLRLNIEGASGLDWPRWKRFVQEVETLGFDGMFISDHFTWPEPPDLNSLEVFVAITYLAGNSKRIHFGPLVSPFSFRDPVFLARQAAAIDGLSEGRMILGVGAGWQARCPAGSSRSTPRPPERCAARIE
jgi:alkanesulfonate monooxygenase SsuD/methylene tetrahydromethanopterin reductase-like flavin-dependent oxidoreductase (luciferase family)